MSVMTRTGWLFSTVEVMVGTIGITAVIWGISLSQFNKDGIIPFVGAFQESFVIGIFWSMFAVGAPVLFIHHLLNFKRLRREEKAEELKYRLEENQRQQREYPHRLKEQEKELRKELESL